MSSRDREPLTFGDFVALPAARALLHKGRPVDIGGRAFDLLLVLLRARGAIISKEEIMREVWPSTYVDEGNLRFQMAMLRKALGASRDMIKTVTGRGYLLVDERGDEGSPGPTLRPDPYRLLRVVVGKDAIAFDQARLPAAAVPKCAAGAELAEIIAGGFRSECGTPHEQV